MNKGAKDKLARAPGENGRREETPKNLQPTTGRNETERKTQKKMEKASRRRSSSAGSEMMERDSDRQKQMEGHCSTGQSSQRAVVPMEEVEEEEEKEEVDEEEGEKEEEGEEDINDLFSISFS